MYTFCTIEQYLDVDHIGDVVDTLYRAGFRFYFLTTVWI